MFLIEAEFRIVARIGLSAKEFANQKLV